MDYTLSGTSMEKIVSLKKKHIWLNLESKEGVFVFWFYFILLFLIEL